MPGPRGPVGKHPDAKHGHKAKAELEHDELELETKIEIPPVPTKADGEDAWHPLAADLYRSFIGSPQAKFFLQSDWARLQVICESLSRDLKPQFVGMEKLWNRDAEEFEMIARVEAIPVKGTNLATYLKGLADQLCSLGDRRRLQFEVKAHGGGGDEDEQPAGLSLIEGGLTG